jgi:NAD(P)-dependent dehydrogenase (short-subunit alcohol dehydrogenase family)
MSKTLEGRVAIVTGASSGIGHATARRLHASGARLVLNARRKEPLERLAEETGGTPVPGDVTDPVVRERLLEACGDRIDVLVNNAGYAQPGPVETVPEEEFRRQFDVNVFALGVLAGAVLPVMRRQRSGRIVNVSSVAGRFGYPLFGWYCSSKHAVEGLSDALRMEAAPWGVHVVLIEPGPVETEFFDVSRERGAGQLSDQSNPYRAFFANVAELERDMRKQAVSADAVARKILRACTRRRPAARYPVGAVAHVGTAVLRFLPRSWLDAGIRKQFRVPSAEEL